MFTCPNCERPLKSVNQWHDCVKVSLESLFMGKKEGMIFIFDIILSDIIDWEGVEVSTTSNCIVFVKPRTFLVIRPMKKELDLKFYLKEKFDQEPIYKNELYSNKWVHHIRIKDVEDVNLDVIKLIRQSYDIS